ncbi:MAG TPA: ATP-binding cassette domain-containing protein [Thermoanaerobaculia bacterium]|nr:ATP-binding cassette domain-containing protein [Thermoanaerobaculia bacterium]
MKRSGRSLLAPEVVQTSEMDCGPAALKSLLEGFGIPVSYGRLREACQIDLDGTSIDTMEEVAGQLGLDAEQVMVPLDHLLDAQARCLPALVVVRQPNGITHFVVVWRRQGGFLQVMDPATGRRWPSVKRFLADVHVHRMNVSAAGWRGWAGSEEFLEVLKARLARLGLPPGAASSSIEEALADPGWRSLARLDATVRMVQVVVESGDLRRTEAARLLRSLLERCRETPDAASAEDIVPEHFWSVRPLPPHQPPDSDGEEQVRFRGAVLVRVRGRREGGGDAPEALSPELRAALAEPPARPGRELLRLLAADGALAPAALTLGLGIAGLGVVLEALLFRAFFDLGRVLDLARQRAGAIAFLIAAIAFLLLLDLPIVEGALRLGRHLELRLRMAFLEKVPRLGDRYFQSRLTADMADRSHGAHRLRLVPDLGESFLRAFFELLFTLGGIVWLDPGSAPLAAGAGLLTLGVPLLLLPRLYEWDLRVRSHSGALSRFYLDALLGLFPIRTHGAQTSMRRQHEGLLVEWARSYLRLRGAEAVADTAVQVCMVSITVALLFEHLARRGLDGGVLLLVYWALKVLSLGHMLILSIATQYPAQRNVTLRLLEPLGAPEETAGVGTAAATATLTGPAARTAVRISFENVAVRAAGHTILEGIDLAVEPGSHVAIVGPSGAGKSTLVGTLLGWHRPAGGLVAVDGEPLGEERLNALRRETAWVDPAVQIWNRSLLENLLYGSPEEAVAPAIERAIREADLAAVLRQLPEGLQTRLGEGGGLVSGGEGQRVRLARALLRTGVRLAILDEPFRGLDRERRRELLARSRRLWHGATLLCITHDVGETLDFPRVLVLEAGRIVEDGPPSDLAARPGSRYRALLDAEHEVREGLWASAVWRRLRMERGRLSESERRP